MSNKTNTKIAAKEQIKPAIKTTQPTYNTDSIISLMNIYLQEFIHRDKHMWSQNYRFFFASLTIMLLPNLTERLGIAIPQFFSSYVWLFPLMGIIIAIVFLYVSLGLAKRFQASSQTYNKIIKLLPEELQRESIKNMPIKILNHTNTYILPILMFAVLIILGVILFIASVTAPAA